MWSRLLTSRNVAVVKYACFFLSGFLFVITPLTSVKEQANQANIILWHGFMLFGAIIGFIGAISKRYLIEGLALPLLGAALAAYVAILLATGLDAHNTTTVGLGFLILTAILGLVGRGIALYELAKIEKDIERRLQ